jgi:LacI family transcriptional regulator
MYHKHSDTNGFSAACEKSSVRAPSVGALGATRCSIVVQAGVALTRSVLDAVQHTAQKGVGSVSIHAVASRSEGETLELIQTLGPQSDAFALLGKNTEQVKAALLDLRALGIPVIALVSDLDANVRSTYIGADNRAAGQLAGFIFGRCLERESETEVALVACNLSYRCWEDREIGFRSLLRRRFPQIKIVEVAKENDSPQATYEAALRVLRNGRAVGGIYNVAGENKGLAQAIDEMQLPSRPLYITHELDEATELLLRTGVIDFLITQNLESVVKMAKRFLIGLRTGAARYGEVNLVPVELISKFNLQYRTAW